MLLSSKMEKKKKEKKKETSCLSDYQVLLIFFLSILFDFKLIGDKK